MEDYATILVDQFLSCVANKLSIDNANMIRGELSEVLRHYKVEPAGENMVPYKGYLPECYEAFFVCKKIEGSSDKTLSLYMLRLNHFFKTLNKPLREITANDVRAYLYTYQKEHGVSNRTLDGIRSALHSFFSWSSGEGYIEKNIMLVVKPIKYERRQRVPLSDYELEQLREACVTKRDKAIIEVFYSTGCRVDELIKLDKQDVDFAKGEVQLFGKGSKHRVSYLSAHSAIALNNYLNSRLDNNDALFVSERSPHNRLTKAGIEKIVRELGEKSGIQRRVYPHLIRHTTATMALQRGMDVTEIQRLLGHSNVATTMIYAKVDQNNVKTSHKKYIQ